MEFMLIMLDERDREWASEEAQAQSFAAMGQWAGGLAQKNILRGGAPLTGEENGVRIRKGTSYDGPFTETKEIIGGYFLIEADSLAAARAIAETCPQAEFATVEVREIIKMGGPE